MAGGGREGGSAPENPQKTVHWVVYCIVSSHVQGPRWYLLPGSGKGEVMKKAKAICWPICRRFPEPALTFLLTSHRPELSCRTTLSCKGGQITWPLFRSVLCLPGTVSLGKKVSMGNRGQLASATRIYSKNRFLDGGELLVKYVFLKSKPNDCSQSANHYMSRYIQIHKFIYSNTYIIELYFKSNRVIH